MTKEYNYCLRCGKRLKSAKYRKIGLGPTCYKKAQKESQKRQLFKP